MVWQGILFLTKMAIKHIQNVVISVRNIYDISYPVLHIGETRSHCHVIVQGY